MPGFHHSVAVLPLPFAVPVSRCRFRTPLPLPLPLRIPMRNSTEFSYVFFLQNNGVLQRQNGETATEERQRNDGNRALYCLVTEVHVCEQLASNCYRIATRSLDRKFYDPIVIRHQATHVVLLVYCDVVALLFHARLVRPDMDMGPFFATQSNPTH